LAPLSKCREHKGEKKVIETGRLLSSKIESKQPYDRYIWKFEKVEKVK